MQPILAVLLLCIMLGAQAQDAPPLETVIVTAQREPEDARQVPLSISVLRGEALDLLTESGRDVRFLAGRLPSLHVESDFGRSFPRFYLRGLGNTDFDLNASQPVSIVFDDVVQENPLLKSMPLFDVEQAEVLRGPQGTLFGRNAPAGVIKYESVRPKAFAESSMRFGAGNFGIVNAEGMLNRPLGAGSALRLSLLSQHRDNRVFNPLPAPRTRAFEGYHDNAARLQWLSHPGDAEVLVNLHWRGMGGRATLFRANVIRPGSPDLVDGFDYASLPSDGFNRQALLTRGANLRLRLPFDSVVLHAVSAYEGAEFSSRADVDAGYGTAARPPSGPGRIPFASETADTLPTHGQWTQELRLEPRHAGPLHWLAGWYGLREQLAVQSFDFDSLNGNALNGYALQHQDSRSWAAFGTLRWQWDAATLLRAGARWTRDRRDFSASRLIAPPGAVPLGPLVAHPRATNLSWDVSAVRRVDGGNVYARIATGYRAPSIQGRILFGNSISVASSERVVSVEAGTKLEWAQRRVRLSGALFGYRVRDMQLTAGSGSLNQNRLVNAARVAGSGVELELQARPSPAWELAAAASYTRTQIDDPGLFVLPCGNGCSVLDPGTGVGRAVRIDGNPLPRVPRTIALLQARRNWDLDGRQVFVAADVSYRGRYNFFLYEAAEYRARPLTEVGLRAGLAWGGGRFALDAFVRNLANRVVLVNAVDFNNLTGVVSEPRIVGLQFLARW